MAFRHELATLPSAGGWPSKAGVHLEASRVRPLLGETVRLEPRQARAWYNLGLERSRTGDALGAIEALRRAKSLQPGASEFPQARATIHARLGEFDAARAALHRCLEINPAHADAHRLLDSLPR